MDTNPSKHFSLSSYSVLVTRNLDHLQKCVPSVIFVSLGDVLFYLWIYEAYDGVILGFHL